MQENYRENQTCSSKKSFFGIKTEKGRKEVKEGNYNFGKN